MPLSAELMRVARLAEFAATAAVTFVAGARCEPLREQAFELLAVRETGQRIVQRLVQDPRFALGDPARLDDVLEALGHANCG